MSEKIFESQKDTRKTVHGQLGQILRLLVLVVKFNKLPIVEV